MSDGDDDTAAGATPSVDGVEAEESHVQPPVNEHENAQEKSDSHIYGEAEIEHEKPSEESLHKKSNLASQFKKQPFYLKAMGALLLISALVWFLLPTSHSQKISKRHLIALDSNWTPLQLMNKRANMTAFIEDLVDLIAKNEELKVQIVANGPNLFDLAENGECDGVISIFPPNQQIAAHYFASHSLYQLGFVLIARKDSEFESSKELAGKAIGIVDSNKILMQLADYPSSIFTSYESVPQILDDLSNGVIEGAVVGNLQASNLLQGLYANKFKIVLPPLIEEGIELYIRKSESAQDFITRFNKGLEAAWDSGEYDKLIEKWDLTNTLQRKRFGG